MSDMNIDWYRARDNPGEMAAWMLSLVDEGPDPFGIIEIPHAFVQTDEQIDETERIVAREFNRAKRERPDLAVKLTPSTPDYPNAALLVVVHEHQWVGGRCVNGCSDRRDTDS